MANSIFIIHPCWDECRRLAGIVACDAYAVRTFVSAEEFLDAVTSSGRACVIAPSDLGGMGIRALLSAISARGLPIVVLGDDSDIATAVELIRAGAVEYLEPPVTSRRLRSVVREALGRHRA